LLLASGESAVASYLTAIQITEELAQNLAGSLAFGFRRTRQVSVENKVSGLLSIRHTNILPSRGAMRGDSIRRAMETSRLSTKNGMRDSVA